MKVSTRLNRLQEVIGSYQSVLVAFSGGVDSALVLKVARDILGRDLAKAVTADSEAVPRWELDLAQKLAREFDVEHRIIKTQELENDQYTSNPENRCYFCKSELYEALRPIAAEWKLKTIANGTQLDDLGDYRPGLMAADERGIKSPLMEAHLTKLDVRELSLELGLSVWDKPAAPCLSSRFPYGHEITPGKLKQVETGETFLRQLGFQIIRLRHFGTKARLELGKNEFIRVTDVELRSRITEFILSLGFKTVIFEPYQNGALNKALEEKSSR